MIFRGRPGRKITTACLGLLVPVAGLLEGYEEAQHDEKQTKNPQRKTADADRMQAISGADDEGARHHGFDTCKPFSHEWTISTH